MKIDLHLHSLFSRFNGDSIKWLGTKEVAKIIYNNNYKMISFTDHSIFDWKLYIEFKDYLKGAITILPGVEVNIITDRGEVGHLLYIFQDDLSEDKLKSISKICSKKLKKNGINHRQANEIFNEFKTIIIPHVGKNNYLEISDLKKINYDAFEITNLNHHNYKKVKEKLNSSIVAFSDTHIWTSFPQLNKLITEIDLDKPNFDSLKQKLQTKKNFIKEQYD